MNSADIRAARRRRIRQLHDEGWSQQAIADELGLAKHTVQVYLQTDWKPCPHCDNKCSPSAEMCAACRAQHRDNHDNLAKGHITQREHRQRIQREGQTCQDCGAIHYTLAWRCADCRAYRNRELNRERRKRNGRNLRLNQRYQARLRDTIPSTRRNQAWTPAEDEIVRQNRPLVEICYLLDRSYQAVTNRRSKLHKWGDDIDYNHARRGEIKRRQKYGSKTPKELARCAVRCCKRPPTKPGWWCQHHLDQYTSKRNR